jgi:hypothetical protein
VLAAATPAGTATFAITPTIATPTAQGTPTITTITTTPGATATPSGSIYVLIVIEGPIAKIEIDDANHVVVVVHDFKVQLKDNDPHKFNIKIGVVSLDTVGRMVEQNC